MKNHFWIPSRGMRLSVMVHTPSTAIGKTPIVICCHGFTGDKIGFNQLTLNLAKALEKAGYAIIRFDYLGSGDSDGEFRTDTSVAGWKEDLSNILAWVKEMLQFSSSPIILYGHSLGGLIVLTYGDKDNQISGRIVFAPVIDAVENFREVILGKKLWEKSRRGETITNFYGKGFTLDGQLVKDLLANGYDPVGCASTLTTPLLIVHGTNDAAVPIGGSLALFEQYSGPKQFRKLPVDHIATGNHSVLQAAILGWLASEFPLE